MKLILRHFRRGMIFLLLLLSLLPLLAVENVQAGILSTQTLQVANDHTGSHPEDAIDPASASRTQHQAAPLAPADEAADKAADKPVDDGWVYTQIVGGQPATPGEYPWQAMITPGPFLCGGTLIHPEWILTAAHCAYNGNALIPMADYTVRLGKHDISTFEADQQVHGVSQVIIYPGYNPSSDVLDIALLRLDSPATLTDRVQVVELLKASSQNNLQAAGVMATAIGWGTTSSGGEISDILLEVDVPIVTQQQCTTAYGSVINDAMVCAGYAEGGKDACQGDSGGPLLVPNGTGGWLQAGITSFGDGCARPEKYGVYTRVSAYSDWIQTQIDSSSPVDIPTTLIRNGNFELGQNGDWTEESELFTAEGLIVKEMPIPPFSGEYVAWLGGGNNETSRLTQSALFNSAITELHYQYWIASQDACDYDFARLLINGTEYRSYALCDSEGTNGWRQARVDVRALRGQTALIEFVVITDATLGSNFFLDDVVLFQEATATPLPGLSVNDAEIKAQVGAGTLASITVTLEPASDDVVTVQYATENDTAQAGIDYDQKSGFLTFAAGQVTQIVTVPVLTNPGPGNSKSFKLRLSNPVQAVLDRAVGQVSIVGSDVAAPALPGLSVEDVAVPEGDTGTTDAGFTVWLSHSSIHTITVEYLTQDDTAVSPQDYQAVTGVLTFAPGVMTQTASVPIVGNTQIQPDRSFTVTLRNPSQATLVKAHAVGTILDDDAVQPLPPLVSIDDAAHTEGDSGSTAMLFQVALSAPSTNTVSVDYFTQDGSAITPVDYQAATGTVSFAPGEVAQTITIQIVGNTNPQPDLSFTVTLTNPVNTLIGKGSGIGVILDDDNTPPVISAFSPTRGPAGTLVTLQGSGFNQVVGVRFNGIAAAFSIDSDTSLRAATPEGARSGPITVETHNSIGTSNTLFVVEIIHRLFLPASQRR